MFLFFAPIINCKVIKIVVLTLATKAKFGRVLSNSQLFGVFRFR